MRFYWRICRHAMFAVIKPLPCSQAMWLHQKIIRPYRLCTAARSGKNMKQQTSGKGSATNGARQKGQRRFTGGQPVTFPRNPQQPASYRVNMIVLNHAAGWACIPNSPFLPYNNALKLTFDNPRLSLPLQLRLIKCSLARR